MYAPLRVVSLFIFSFITLSLSAQNNPTSNDWPAYGHDGGGMRYSPSKIINDKNVNKLDQAWSFQTGELKTYEGTSAASKAAFEATPLMIDKTLYFSTPSDRVFAIDAVTGQQQWVYDPKVNMHNDFSEVSSRGVSSWPMSQGFYPDRRIYVATIDGRLICLDAKKGTPITTFGNQGTIDLKAGFGKDLSATSPPAVIKNLVIVGSSLGDNQRFDYPRGTVRAFDALTGELKWSWDPIPQDSTDAAWKTWNGTKAHKTGAANAWAPISVDPARDLVFVPTSSPSPDYYGGERIGQNLYGNSIVALHASTGKIAWYFQVVHHDLWDYDIAAQPMLVDITRNGRKIPAVVVGTKMGHIFVLNRENGQKLFPVAEKPMPATDIAGETSWPTQPVPVLPAPLGIQKISKEDAWGLDSASKLAAEKRISQYINKGPFTPPSFQGSLMTPGNVGGIHWGGMCFDPQSGMLYTNINRIVPIITMIPRDKADSVVKQRKELMRVETGRQEGTPYIMKRDYLFAVSNGQMVLQTKPPWGTLVGIDMNVGQKKWEVPLGFMLDPTKNPGAEKWGSLNFGGAIVTAGNLIFVAASMDSHFRAFDATTGTLLWDYTLPAGGQATPMTYVIDGKQYVVIAAGGHGKLGTKLGDYVVAFTLK
ncbi:MAG: pyrroloquinoline quinone-dependent dehydrogenase [Bacteroidetes bacterium]|nr:MAG: pyrroloquinoline quinone-dependent dehydrogenase [Bacteroidota bacterium]